MYRIFMAVFLCGFLASCQTTGTDRSKVKTPEGWDQLNASSIEKVQSQDLHQWWRRFEEPVLDQLVETALLNNPDRNIAAARIAEARGLHRTQRSFLFPSIDASGSYGRQDTGFGGANSVDSFYDAGFDASYELDLFGNRRHNTKASLLNLFRREAEYQDISLSLAAEVTRTYVDHKRALKRLLILNKNVESQQRTVDLVRDLKKFGSVPQSDVERAENLLNSTKAEIPEAERQAENARLRLAVLTGQFPNQVVLDTYDKANFVLAVNVVPVLMSPAEIISQRPDIKASMQALEQATALSSAEVSSLFPQITLSAFYGFSDGAFVNTATIWNFAVNAAVNLIDFGRIEGRIDAAKAREVQTFEAYRKTVLQAVSEVEAALVDYTKHAEREKLLRDAHSNAKKSVELSETLYREGEGALIDLLDVQRQLNVADLALTGAVADKAQSLVRLYKALGVY